MIPNCPACSAPGENQPARDRAVRFCPNCNLVYDGLETATANIPRTAGTFPQMTADEWEYAAEQARAELERAAARFRADRRFV